MSIYIIIKYIINICNWLRFFLDYTASWSLYFKHSIVLPPILQWGIKIFLASQTLTEVKYIDKNQNSFLFSKDMQQLNIEIHLNVLDMSFDCNVNKNLYEYYVRSELFQTFSKVEL